MIFGPKPSKLEQARKAVSDAAHEAASVLSDAASNVAESAYSLAESAHSLVESAPKVAAAVSDVVASRVEAARHRAEDEASENKDSLEAAQLKAAATKKAAELAAREAERAARDAQKKAEAEISRIEKDLARKRADFESQQATIQSQTEKLGEQSLAWEEQASEIHTRRKAPVTVEVNNKSDDEEEEDDGFEYQVVQEKEGGSPLWLLVGGAVFVGAALVYFFAPGSGRRSRAAIKDRLSKVKEDAVDKVTGAADATTQKTQDVVDRAEELSHRASDKLAEIADSSVPTASNDDLTAKTSLDHAVETYEDAVPSSTEPLADEVRVASLDAVDGVAVDSSEELGEIGTAATAGAELDEPQHPNIFDKVAEIAGNAASAAEHLAGTDKDDAKTEGEEVAPQSAEATPPAESAPLMKKKKNK